MYIHISYALPQVLFLPDQFITSVCLDNGHPQTDHQGLLFPSRGVFRFEGQSLIATRIKYYLSLVILTANLRPHGQYHVHGLGFC